MQFNLMTKHYTMLRDKINEVLKSFNLNLSVEEPAKVVLAKMMRLADGTEVGTSADDFAEGVDVYVVIEGEPTIAPDGDHTLEDGRVISVAGGVITAITKSEEEMSADVVAIVSKLAERVNALETANAASAEALSAATKEKETLATKLAEITSKFEKLSKSQASSSVKDKATQVALAAEKTETKPVALMTIKERIAHYRAKAN
jgi:hypothetical protein